jgi:hypothetical protein
MPAILVEISRAHAVANSWAEFEGKVLLGMAEDLSPATLGVSQLSFYFGELTMLNIVQAVIENAGGEGATELAMDGLRDEVGASSRRAGRR